MGLPCSRVNRAKARDSVIDASGRARMREAVAGTWRGALRCHRGLWAVRLPHPASGVTEASATMGSTLPLGSWRGRHRSYVFRDGPWG